MLSGFVIACAGSRPCPEPRPPIVVTRYEPCKIKPPLELKRWAFTTAKDGCSAWACLRLSDLLAIQYNFEILVKYADNAFAVCAQGRKPDAPVPGPAVPGEP